MSETPSRLNEALVGRYEIERELGEGGMATVYLADDVRHERKVAIKVLRPELAQAIGPERFLQEIQVAAQLTHPNLLTLHDSGEAAGLLYYVMPCVEGETLGARLRREKQLPIDEAMRLTSEVVDALRYAHGCGVVHRDIKPDNIMVLEDHAVVMDFGISRAVDAPGRQKLTQTGIVLGSPAYMSPEQASGDVDARTDIYAVGCVLYEMLAGTPPFDGPTAQALMARHALDPVPGLRSVRPAVSARLEHFVLEALAKVPADRFATMALFQERLQEVQRGEGPSDPVPPWGSSPTIAVLPFSNLSTDPEQDYFCTGMAQEITHALVRVGDLRVLSGAAVRTLGEQPGHLRDAAREWKVDLILDGSVRRAGDRLRITAQLTATHEGIHVWSERYDRPAADVFEIQDEITRAIAAALHAKLGIADPAGPVRPTDNLDAYDAYLRGIHSFQKRSRAANERAIGLLEQATTLDPGFALGFTALAWAYIEQFFTHDPREAWEEKAFAAIEKARSLDPGLAEIYVAKGNLLWTRARRFPHREAIAEYRRAVELNPRLPEAHNELARVYWHIGMLDEALDALRRAMDLDPGFVDGQFRLAWLELQCGDYEGALARFRKVPRGSLVPAVDTLIATALLYLDRGEEARAQMAGVEQRHRSEPDYTSVEAIFLALDGEEEKAEERIASATAAGRHLGHFHHIAYNIAVAYALMNRPDEALKWLRDTANDGFPCYPWFERDPCLRTLRGDPRFTALVEGLKNRWANP